MGKQGICWYVSIPQAVGTIATFWLWNHDRKQFVSIPKTISTVATKLKACLSHKKVECFNTASGKYCCSILFVYPSFLSGTRDVRASSSLRSSVFPSLWSGTRDVRTSSSLCFSAASLPSSHTANSKYYCNLAVAPAVIGMIIEFQYRKQ